MWEGEGGRKERNGAPFLSWGSRKMNIDPRWKAVKAESRFGKGVVTGSDVGYSNGLPLADHEPRSCGKVGQDILTGGINE